MQRISEPQIVEALIRNKTSPCPGADTGMVRISTVEFPGRKAAVMVSCIVILTLFRVRQTRGCTQSHTSPRIRRGGWRGRGTSLLSYGGVISPFMSHRASHVWPSFRSEEH